MLIDIDTGRAITRVPFAQTFAAVRRALTDCQGRYDKDGVPIGSRTCFRLGGAR